MMIDLAIWPKTMKVLTLSSKKRQVNLTEGWKHCAECSMAPAVL